MSARRRFQSRWPWLGALALGGVVAAVALLLSSQTTTAHVGGPTAPAHLAPDVADPQFAPALEARIDRQAGGHLMTEYFYSKALGKEADYLIYLPAGYSSSRPLPVFYLLHGSPGWQFAFTVNAGIEVQLEQLIRSGKVKPMILVFPDGRIDERMDSDSEWANTSSGQYESDVMDVVQDVDSRFATVPTRQDRAIAGLSAGGYGATNIGLHQLASFGLIQAWSGYFTETHDGVFAHADAAVMAYNSPLAYIRTLGPTLRRFPLRAFIYAGRDDPFSRQIPAMAAAFKAAGVSGGSAIYPGGHSWKVWTAHVPQMLEMAGDDFAHPLAG